MAARTEFDRFEANAAAFTDKLDRRKRARTMLLVAAPFAAIMFFMAATKGAGTRDDAGAYDAAVTWAERAPTQYQLTYTLETAAGVHGPAVVAVSDGVVVSYETADPSLEDRPVYTVAQALFSIEAAALDSNGSVDFAHYDAQLGYPTSFKIDPALDRDGDELLLRVTDFQASE